MTTKNLTEEQRKKKCKFCKRGIRKCIIEGKEVYIDWEDKFDEKYVTKHTCKFVESSKCGQEIKHDN